MDVRDVARIVRSKASRGEILTMADIMSIPKVWEFFDGDNSDFHARCLVQYAAEEGLEKWLGVVDRAQAPRRVLGAAFLERLRSVERDDDLRMWWDHARRLATIAEHSSAALDEWMMRHDTYPAVRILAALNNNYQGRNGHVWEFITYDGQPALRCSLDNGRYAIFYRDHGEDSVECGNLAGKCLVSFVNNFEPLECEIKAWGDQ